MSQDFVKLIRARWRSVVLIFVVCVIAGVAFTLVSKKQYTASAQIFVSTADATDLSAVAQANTFTESRVQSYTSVVTAPKVVDPVAQQLQLGVSGRQLATKVTASAPANKVLIDISAVWSTPSGAADIANATANQFSSVIEDIDKVGAGDNPVVKLTVTQPAVAPSSPSSPDITLNLLVAVFGGLLLGIAYAIVRGTLDTAIHDPETLERVAQAPVLAAVPFDKRAVKTPNAFRGENRSTRAESYRQLRTALQFVKVDRRPKTIAVTSALPGEGKSTTAINLASALAEGGSRVCLVDADLRRPSVARVLGLVSETGFTTVLSGAAEIEDVLQNSGMNLAVLTAGAIPPNPSELLGSEQAGAIIDYLAERVDYVVIDTAPLLPVTDGATVAAKADVTIMCVRANRTTRQQVSRAMTSLNRVEAEVAGLVFSMASAKNASDYGYYYNSPYGDLPLAVEPPEVILDDDAEPGLVKVDS